MSTKAIGDELVAFAEDRAQLAHIQFVCELVLSLEVAIGIRSHMEIVRQVGRCASLALRNLALKFKAPGVRELCGNSIAWARIRKGWRAFPGGWRGMVGKRPAAPRGSSRGVLGAGRPYMLLNFLRGACAVFQGVSIRRQA